MDIATIIMQGEPGTWFRLTDAGNIFYVNINDAGIVTLTIHYLTNVDDVLMIGVDNTEPTTDVADVFMSGVDNNALMETGG